MKVTTSLIPELVFYTKYSDCTITEALLHAFQNSKGNTLSLPEIGNIKINGNRLIGSYGKAIMTLRKKGYNIKLSVYHHPKNKITCVTYRLENPTYSGSIQD